MAFPTVASLQETTVASMSTTHNIAHGATVNAGDLLVMIFVGSQVGADETYTITDPSGWTLLAENQYNDGSGNNRQNTGVYYKVASGSEGGTTVNVATSASVSAAAQVYRITAGTHNSAVEIGTFSEVEDGANPNPPSLTPSWGSADTLWLAVATWEDSDFFASAAPASYTNLTTEIADSTEDAVISSARRENATATEDPGTFTAAAEKHQAFVIAIEPAGGGGAGSMDGSILLEGTDDYLILEGGTDDDPILQEGFTWPAAASGTAAVTLDAFVSAASGTFTPPPITGTSAVTLADFVSAASGTFIAPITGTSAVTLGDFLSTAAGTFTPPPITGTSAVTLGDFVSAASGTYTLPPITGTAAVTLGEFLSTATGIHAAGPEGTAAVTLGDFISDASGTFTPAPATGTADITLGDFISDGVGTFSPPAITGTAAVTLDDFVTSADGAFSFPITGTADVVLGDFAAVGVGAFYTTNVPQGGVVSGGSGATDTSGGTLRQSDVAGTSGASKLRPSPGSPRVGGGGGQPSVEE